MKPYKPVAVSKGAFNFCKYSVAVILWLAFIFRLKWLIIVSFVILALSAILKVRRAPMIVLYSLTINKVFKTSMEMLDENGMRFAHILGAVLNGICLVLLYFISENIGWWFVFAVAILKTVSAMGYCGALKLYNCMRSGSCCMLAREK